ncbi:MAG: hypothetical protein ACOY3Y_10860, partial [Acidobacteriota bacterium]
MRRHPHSLALVLVLAAACRFDPTMGSFRDAALADATVADATPASFVVTAGGPGDDVARSIALDRAGNIFLAGSYSGTAQFGAHTLSATHAHESFVAKLDPRGDFVWVRALGGTAKEQPQALALDRDGRPHVVAAFAGTITVGGKTLEATGPADLVIAKLDPVSGGGEWAVAASRGVWNVSEDRGLAIAVDRLGQVTITGAFRSTATFGSRVLTSAGGTDIFVTRLDARGEFLWAVSAGGTDMDQGSAVAVDAGGRSYASGYFTETARFGSTELDAGGFWLAGGEPGLDRSWSCFVAEVDPQGAFERVRTPLSAPNSACNGIALVEGGSVLVTGTAGGAPFVARLNADGSIPWVLSEGFPIAGTPRIGSAIAVHPSTSSVVAITGQLPDSSAAADVLFARLDSNGCGLTATVAGGDGDDRGNAIALDGNGNAFVAGAFSGTAVFSGETATA